MAEVGGVNRRIVVLAAQKSPRLYEKNNESKDSMGMTQVVQCLTSKHKDLSSNPSTAKKKIKCKYYMIVCM
jgi:hypothetical protein